MKSPYRLIIFGRQGSGKGTQCRRLAERFGIIHISTGDLLRENIALGTSLGLKISPILEQGGLVDDETMQLLIEDRLRQSDVIENGFILDGIPRTLGQAKVLLDFLGSDGLDLALNLEVPLLEVTARMEARARADDIGDVIKERLRLYEQETVPAMEWFGSLGLLQVVDGVGSEVEVTDRILESLAASSISDDLC